MNRIAFCIGDTVCCRPTVWFGCINITPEKKKISINDFNFKNFNIWNKNRYKGIINNNKNDK